MDLAASILQYDTMYAPAKAHIESVAYQEMLRDYITTKRFIPGFGKKINPRNSKSSRLESLQPWFFQDKVFIKKDMTPLVDELLLYPRGRHDDLLDGLYYAFLGSYKPPDEEYEGEGNKNNTIKSLDWSIL
jgi:phage terminase large subunit-like protein